MADSPADDAQEVRSSTIQTSSFTGEEASVLILLSQQLKAALWYAVGKIVDEETMRQNRNATPQFTGALTEMVWMQIGRRHATPHPFGMMLLRAGH